MTIYDQSTGEVIKRDNYALLSDNDLIALSEHILALSKDTVANQPDLSDAVDQRSTLRAIEEKLATQLRFREVQLEVGNNVVEARMRYELDMGFTIPAMQKQGLLAKPGSNQHTRSFPDGRTSLADYQVSHKQSSIWQKYAKAGEALLADYALTCKEDGRPMSGEGFLKYCKAMKPERTQADGDILDDLIGTPGHDVQLGEWWQLGEHSLYCGDTSDPHFKHHLPQAAFAFADPPYNANAAEWDHDFEWLHNYLIDYAPVVAVTPGISAISDFFSTSAQMPYAWSMAAWITNGMTRGALGFGNWMYIALFSTLDSIHRNAQDVIRISIKASDKVEDNFKGRKPSALMIALIELFTQEGDTVIDPFLGSGTTLLVAERTGRVCVGGEIDPVRCAGIIAKWEALTGLSAERV